MSLVPSGVLPEDAEWERKRWIATVKFPGAIGGTLTAADIRIVESTGWKVVPRQKWSAWRTQGTEQKAVRLQIKLRLLDLQVSDAEVRASRICGRAARLAHAKAGFRWLKCPAPCR